MAWKCELCGGTEKGVRNYYKNQPQNPYNPTIGFAVEEYCLGCGVALSSIPNILKAKKLVEDRLKNLSPKQKSIHLTEESKDA